MRRATLSFIAVVLAICSTVFQAFAFTPISTEADNVGWERYEENLPEDFYHKDAIVLKACCYYPNAGPIGHGIHWETMNYIEKLMGGRLKFQRYYASSLHSLADGFKALRSGLSDFAQAYPAENQGAFDLMSSDGLPFLYNNVVVGSAVQRELYPKWLKKEYEAQGIYIGMTPFFDCQVIISKVPIRKMEDLKGLKVNGYGGRLMRATINALGGTSVYVTVPDLFIALQRGTIDAIVWSAGSIIPWRFHEVAKYVTITGQNIGSIPYGLNKRKFDSLPEDFRKDFYRALQLATNHMSEGYTKLEIPAYEKLQKAGVEIIELNAAEKARWVKACEPVWEDYIKEKETKGLPVREFIKDLKATAAKFNGMTIPEIREYTNENTIHGIIDGL